MTVELTEYETLKSGYPLLTSSRTGLMFQKDFRDKASTDNNSTKFSIVPYGKCTYRHMSDDNIFHFNINTIAENGLVSKEYPVFDANDNYNLKFIVDYLNNSKEFVRFCTQRKLGGTRTRLYYKNLCDFKMYVPQLEEQNIIAQHLKLLDNLITLHQRKCDNLKIIKKSMLDNLFPKIGEKVPKWRFKGFNNDWEQRKLGELLSFLKDGTHGTHADVDDGPLLLSAKNIKNGGIYWDETDRRISYGEYEKIHSNFSLESGDVLLTIVGSIGETAILKDSEGITFQRSVAFLRPNNKITPDFLYSEIQTPIFQKELDSRKSTSAQPGIYLGDLAEIPLIFSTKIDEQKKIGEYFSNLDNLITLHQRKIKYILKEVFIWIILIKRVVLKKPLSPNYRIMVGRRKLLSILQNRI